MLDITAHYRFKNSTLCVESGNRKHPGVMLACGFIKDVTCQECLELFHA